MKIYLLEAETGLYLGQDYADTSSLAGICELPKNSTTKPPEDSPDQVTVMNRLTMQWELHRKEQVAGVQKIH
ncbi:MAG: hypothetical protein P4L44_03095 [Oryzomonas sp.]|uniref:hypothetical protein n=1 Tax=Oryzomonas sp. TaxID=2855186 RepID=UPI002845B1C2|nr:hypothetical protein [Oryzomonas sp.]MDR3578932.1 hypothetical protein [Oryzomonas sp.]